MTVLMHASERESEERFSPASKLLGWAGGILAAAAFLFWTGFFFHDIRTLPDQITALRAEVATLAKVVEGRETRITALESQNKDQDRRLQYIETNGSPGVRALEEKLNAVKSLGDDNHKLLLCHVLNKDCNAP